MQGVFGARGVSVGMAWPQTGGRGCLVQGRWNAGSQVGRRARHGQVPISDLALATLTLNPRLLLGTVA